MSMQWLVRALGICGLTALLIGLSGCPNSVTPTTPVNFQLEIPSSTLGVFATTGPTTSATATSPQGYNVLPLLTSTGEVIVRAFLTTPYPTSLAITATDNTGQNVTIPQVAANSPGPSTGYYQVITVGATNPAQWHIVIRYPDSFKNSRIITTAISDVSGSQSSAPFSFALISTLTTVNVKIVTQNNDGMVTSNPVGINCPPTCSFDSKGFTSIMLSESVLHNETEFIGWQGNCSGTGSNCTLQLNGTTVTATANFRIHTNTTPTTLSCPAAPVIPGKTWVENPNCGTIPTNQGATLQCDSQGFFCCGATNGTPSPRCSGQNLTPVTCAPDNTGNMGNNESLLPADKPLGCYAPDMFP